MILTPNMGNKYQGGPWAADNGCFNAKSYVGDTKWFAWLQKNSPNAGTCLFATAPDVVGDHDRTVLRSTPWLARIRSLGYLAAFVSQDGATPETTPWDDFDVLFIGGTDAHKLGPEARVMAAHAVAVGKKVHMGRVNSEKRLRYAKFIGCETADGTYLAHGPDENLPKMLAWFRGVNDQLELS